MNRATVRPLVVCSTRPYNAGMKTDCLAAIAVFAVAAFAFMATESMSSAEPEKMRILFLCTGNSCRSQMAEGWARALKADSIEPYSAGIEKHGLNPNAVAVMLEAGVDITAQQSKNVDELPPVELDVVVTVCGHADDHCPIFPAATRVVHVPFDDPPKLAADAATEEEALSHYRRVRDEIREFVACLPDSLSQ